MDINGIEYYESYREKQTLYDILGVTRTADAQGLYDAANRELRASWNNANDTIRIKNAYAILSNPDLRKEYDKKLAESIREAEIKETETKEAEAKEAVAKEAVAKEAEAKEAGAKEAEAKEAEAKEAVAKETETKEAETKEAVAKEAEAIKYIPIKRIEKEIEQPKTTMREEIDDEPLLSPETKKNLIRSAIIAGGIGLGFLVIGGIPGVVIGGIVGIASGDFYKKHAGKIKLQKEPKKLEIKDVDTEETRLINQYSEKLENEIYDLLSKPNKNYELEIALKKYENMKELLEKRIHFKSNEIKKNGYSVLKKLEIIGMEKKHSRIEKTLKQLHEQCGISKKSSLNKFNMDIVKKSQEISEIKSSDEKKELSKEEMKKIDKLEIEQSRLLGERDEKANKMALHRDFIAYGQVALVKLKNARNKIEGWFNSEDEEKLEESKPKSF